MTNLIMINLLLLFTLLSCAKPRATVFLDKSLSEEENVKFCFTGDMGKDTPHQQEIADALNVKIVTEFFS